MHSAHTLPWMSVICNKRNEGRTADGGEMGDGREDAVHRQPWARPGAS